MWHMLAKHGSTAARDEQVLQELAKEINDPSSGMAGCRYLVWPRTPR